MASGIIAISTGQRHTCALSIGGEVRCWGYNGYGQLGDGTNTDSSVPVDVSGLAIGATAISLGHIHSCALTSAGGVTCWGSSYGSTPVDISGLTSGVIAIGAGAQHSCVVTSDGGVSCWGGDNQFGELGDGTWTNSRFR
jgi:alpha-tubulin suppressor-like RCC1 family protein